MPSLYSLRPRFMAYLRPIAEKLVARRVTANLVTIAALTLAVAIGFLVTLTEGNRIMLLILAAVIVLRMALNALDGVMAEEHGQATRQGAMLNELADFASDAFLYLPIAYAAAVSPPLLVAVVVTGLLAEAAGLLGPMFGSTRRMEGPFGSTDRAVFFALLALILAIGLGGAWVSWVLIAALGLGGWTVWNRTRKIMRDGTTNPPAAGTSPE